MNDAILSKKIVWFVNKSRTNSISARGIHVTVVGFGSAFVYIWGEKDNRFEVHPCERGPTSSNRALNYSFFYRWPSTKLFVKESILLNAVLVNKNVQASIVFDQSCANCFESVRGILRFLLLSHLLYVIWVKMVNMNRYISNNLVPRVLSYPPPGASERDPGKRWSRVSQNLGDYKKKIWGRSR